jgi:hypothetical protein
MSIFINFLEPISIKKALQGCMALPIILIVFTLFRAMVVDRLQKYNPWNRMLLLILLISISSLFAGYIWVSDLLGFRLPYGIPNMIAYVGCGIIVLLLLGRIALEKPDEISRYVYHLKR